jgi:hypothetical protein
MGKRQTATRGPISMTEVVRQAIRNSGQTLYRVAKDSGVNYPIVHRFVVHNESIALTGFVKLCAYLGLTLKPEREEK